MRIYEVLNINEQTEHFSFDGVEFTRTAQGWVANGKLYSTGTAEHSYLDAVAKTVPDGGSTTQAQATKRSGLLDPDSELASDLPAFNPQANPGANVDSADKASRMVAPNGQTDFKSNTRDPNYYKKWQHKWGKPTVA